MRQDSKNRRKSEVELFAGTIRRLAKKHGIPVPVNDWLYDQVHTRSRVTEALCLNDPRRELPAGDFTSSLHGRGGKAASGRLY